MRSQLARLAQSDDMQLDCMQSAMRSQLARPHDMQL
jgi:hypothetical protein